MRVIADIQTVNRLFGEAKHLTPEYRLRLAHKLIQTLIPLGSQGDSQSLRFGELGGDETLMSSLEDFAIAEWQPTDEELDRP